jgi:cytochrome c5
MSTYFSAYALFLLIILGNSYAESHHPEEFLASIHGSKIEGKEIYNHFCVNCHDQNPKIPLGAPRVGKKEDWKKRIDQGMAQLFQHTDEGLNAMPPRGGCFECSDEQLRLAICYMIENNAICSSKSK